MAGNMGHPFFGNQYAGSSYSGGYHYDWIPNSKSIALSQSVNGNLSKASKILEIGKSAMNVELVVSVVVATAINAYFQYKRINKEYKSKAEAFQTIEFENIGTCKHCSKPLSPSEYVDENTSDSHTAYIICRKCGEKNYAWYSD